MRTRLFFTWAAIRWVLLMLVVASSLQAPAVARSADPIKPMRVWQGTASWYGHRFHGRTTANGESFDMAAPTAAHRTLPMGAIVRVVNLRTGKGRIVRINDRGPFIDGREIDVSHRVAQTLGFEDRGIARVRLELLEVPKRRLTPRPVAD